LKNLLDECPDSLERRGYDLDPETLEERLADFDLRARRLVHLGEVSYKEQIDPVSLAVSQTWSTPTFKIEKAFDRDAPLYRGSS
jgi:hypothetical protein